MESLEASLRFKTIFGVLKLFSIVRTLTHMASIVNISEKFQFVLFVLCKFWRPDFAESADDF